MNDVFIWSEILPEYSERMKAITKACFDYLEYWELLGTPDIELTPMV